MSDSESDFAYESAGEDAELEDQANDENSNDPVRNNSELVDIPITESPEGEKTVSDAAKTECTQGQLTGVTKDMSSLTLDETSEGVQALTQCHGSREQPTDSSNKVLEEKESTCKEQQLLNPETEPKRVKLRLEKKLEEKNQSTAAKEPVEVSPSSESENVPAQNEQQSSSWGWGSWGTSLLSSAASSVTTFTSQVSQGIETVLETVETTLGAPPPEELAASLNEKDENVDLRDETAQEPEDSGDNKTSGSHLFSGVTSLTKVIENTGAKVIMSGLDTLELIGKKTIDILTEGDPGLRNKRAYVSEGMTLSQVLRDAKNKAEESSSGEADGAQEDIQYTRCFDEFQGLVHLEALEMLSKQSQSKVQSLQNIISSDSKKEYVLGAIKKICEDLPADDDTQETERKNQDFVKLISDHMEALRLPLNSSKLEQVHRTIEEMTQSYKEQKDRNDEDFLKEIYHQAISCLAEFTAKSVEYFHKIGELILVQPDTQQASIIGYATHLAGLTSVLIVEADNTASKFCDSLYSAASRGDEPESVDPAITSIYLEASNSTSYIQDAFQLLIPVLQLEALQ